MKIIELRKKSKGELQKILEDDREKLRQLRFDLSAGKVKNVREIRHIKKEIAKYVKEKKICTLNLIIAELKKVIYSNYFKRPL